MSVLCTISTISAAIITTTIIITTMPLIHYPPSCRSSVRNVRRRRVRVLPRYVPPALPGGGRGRSHHGRRTLPRGRYCINSSVWCTSAEIHCNIAVP